METETYIDYLYSIKKGLFTRPFRFYAENTNLLMNKDWEVFIFMNKKTILLCNIIGRGVSLILLILIVMILIIAKEFLGLLILIPIFLLSNNIYDLIIIYNKLDNYPD